MKVFWFGAPLPSWKFPSSFSKNLKKIGHENEWTDHQRKNECVIDG